MASDQLNGQLDLLLLHVLHDEPGHGYSVIAGLRRRSQGTFDLPEGTVYPVLHRLEERGLLVSGWERVNGRRRRLYRLTADGTAALAERRSRWAGFVSTMSMVLTPAVEGAAS